MNKTEFIELIAKKNGITKKDAHRIVDSVFEAITEVAKKGDVLRVPKFGTFKVVTRKERKARNPQTGQIITVPESKVLRFSPSLELRSL